MAQHDAGTAGSQITQAELSCLQIDSRGDLVGEGAEHAAVSAQRNLSGVSCCDWGPFTSGKKKTTSLLPPTHTYQVAEPSSMGRRIHLLKDPRICSVEGQKNLFLTKVISSRSRGYADPRAAQWR